jgi:hypothetical protein
MVLLFLWDEIAMARHSVFSIQHSSRTVPPKYNSMIEIGL